MAKTLLDKIWDQHLVAPEGPDRPALLYIDLHLIHEVTSPQAFRLLKSRGLNVRRPDLCLATADHSVPSSQAEADGRRTYVDSVAEEQVRLLGQHCAEFNIPYHGLGSEHQGIVHVIGPELGATQPGKTIVCGDSHTSTHGAFGALAFGIGTSEVGHVLASQCLLQRKPKSFAITVNGKLQAGVSAKDLILAIIQKLGMHGGTGYVFEYRGSAIEALSMEERMTVCNMSIEAGARAGLIAPDETTFQYLHGRKMVPQGADWDRAVEKWRQLFSDSDAVFDRELVLNADEIEPMLTYGTNPGMSVGVTHNLPKYPDPNHQKAMAYMGFEKTRALTEEKVDVVFIGSCTNSRISDLRAAAQIFRNRTVAKGVRALVVPGSVAVKKQAESEGLDQVFLAAGAEWREPCCSMCIAMNGDQLQPGELAVSTSNRNFEGRQGKGGRTLLASPQAAAAAAINGRVTDPRLFLEVGHAAATSV
ncbi:MAG: 3-isopropylmalate dehydratase large subunit [Acidobacteria bacterium]|nr:3-isopropylmalate dehydratase large subunit [Acidobacteriota bacterium]MCB9399326.1 3-isopropylmalate dehydratase large subunit [Acidobacteriota bacterium]